MPHSIVDDSLLIDTFWNKLLHGNNISGDPEWV